MKIKEKATIYDLWRMCKNHEDDCKNCPLKECVYNFDWITSHNEIDKMNEAILNWCKEHPIKTRQEKFLEMFPNAAIDTNTGVIDICPKMTDCEVECSTPCDNCSKKYWLAEVKE